MHSGRGWLPAALADGQTDDASYGKPRARSPLGAGIGNKDLSKCSCDVQLAGG